VIFQRIAFGESRNEKPVNQKEKMMESKRQRQVAELIKRHFSAVLMEQGYYLYGNKPLVTVTEVQLTPDLLLARIYLSIFNAEDKQAVLDILEKHNKKLRHALASRIRRQVRRIPEIEFYEDNTLDEMWHLNEVFDRLRAEGQMGEEE